MRKIVALGLAALALTASACSRSKAADSSDGDEKVTLAQFEQRRVDQMMQADADQDGKISRDEFIAYMKQRLTDRGDDPDDPQMAARFQAMFTRMDAKGDGLLTQDEIRQSAAAMFNRIDTAHKGYITRNELRERFRRARGGPGGAAGPGGGAPAGGAGA